MLSSAKIADRFPLPMRLVLERYSAVGFSRDTGGIGGRRALVISCKRPVCLSTSVQRILHTQKEVIVFEEHLLDESLHSRDQLSCSSREDQQPIWLDVIRQRRKESYSPDRTPVSDTEALNSNFDCDFSIHTYLQSIKLLSYTMKILLLLFVISLYSCRSTYRNSSNKPGERYSFNNNALSNNNALKRKE